ncbi:hypothetical protein CHH75_23855 [Paenibacillus sp. 7541]|nr:hypothetical protein CHH75_23855 [Paenibacillus sp. 7541]
MFKTYNLFDHRNIEDLIPEIVYYYLFEGLSLTQIEYKLFKTEHYKGWLSKTFLNYYSIDTEGDNKGNTKEESFKKLLMNFIKVPMLHTY